MAKKIHYHTDCPFFAGCENMLVNFWSSSAIRDRFEISFSYRDTQQYTEGLRQRAELDFPVYPLSFPGTHVLAVVPEYWPHPLKRAAQLLSSLISTLPILAYQVWVLYKLFSRIHPDVLHINNGGYPAALSARAAAIAAKLADIPHVIMVVNNLADDYRRPVRWKDYPLDRLVSRSVSRFVTGSFAAAKQLKTILRLDEAKCLAIQNGIALRQLTETPHETRKRLGLEQFDGVICGVVALMVPRKGHQVLLKAMVKLLGRAQKDALNFKVLLEGDGPLCKELQAFVIDNQLSAYCVFVGNEKNVMNFMAALDVLILPSIDEEDFPNVILEAMGLGKPVIASRLAGTPEQVVEGVTGFLVAPGNADQLASAISRLCLDGQLRSQMGRAGLRRFQERFTAEMAVKNYVSLYQSLAGI